MWTVVVLRGKGNPPALHETPDKRGAIRCVYHLSHFYGRATYDLHSECQLVIINGDEWFENNQDKVQP